MHLSIELLKYERIFYTFIYEHIYINICIYTYIYIIIIRYFRYLKYLKNIKNYLKLILLCKIYIHI